MDAILTDRFGLEVPAVVALQGESAKRRLRRFAAMQAARAAEGWKVVATERRMRVVYGHTEVKGRCDRIDFNPSTGIWCVIDYKTWDKAERAVAYTDVADKETGESHREWHSLQLPLYCAMLDADPEFPDARRDMITASYCVLSKSAEQTLYTDPFSGAEVPQAEEKVRELIDGIERGVFWPASDAREYNKRLAVNGNRWNMSPAEKAEYEFIPREKHKTAGALKALFDRNMVDFQIPKIDEEDIDKLVEMIGESAKPMLICGGGVVRARADAEFNRFADLVDAPTAITVMGGGGISGRNPHVTGMIGMHGSQASNIACNECDLLVAVGCRFSDRVALDPASFASQAKLVHIDIDRSEINKNVQGISAENQDYHFTLWNSGKYFYLDENKSKRCVFWFNHSRHRFCVDC